MLGFWGESLPTSGFQVCQNSNDTGPARNVTVLAED